MPDTPKKPDDADTPAPTLGSADTDATSRQQTDEADKDPAAKREDSTAENTRGNKPKGNKSNAVSSDGLWSFLGQFLPGGLKTWWSARNIWGRAISLVVVVAVAIILVWWNSVTSWAAGELEQLSCDVSAGTVELPWCEPQEPVSAELQSTARCPSGILPSLLVRQGESLGQALGPDAQRMRICADTTVSAEPNKLPETLAGLFPGCLVRAETDQNAFSLFACTGSRAVCATPFAEGPNAQLVEGEGAPILLCLGNKASAKDAAQCATDGAVRRCSSEELRAAGF